MSALCLVPLPNRASPRSYCSIRVRTSCPRRSIHRMKRRDSSRAVDSMVGVRKIPISNTSPGVGEKKSRTPYKCSAFVLKNGRDRRIRTSDFLLPRQARYQAALCPDTKQGKARSVKIGLGIWLLEQDSNLRQGG